MTSKNGMSSWCHAVRLRGTEQEVGENDDWLLHFGRGYHVIDIPWRE